jgi:signal transduction histidine kinase
MHQPTGHLLMRISSESFERTGEALRRCMPRVMDVALERLRTEVPELRERSEFHLQDALPEVLEQLVRVMSEGMPAVALLAEKARKHAAHREEQELDLDQMLLEYQLLREALPPALVAELGRDLETEEANRIHGAIDLSLREAAAEFAENQRRRLQSEAASMTKYLSFLSHDLRGNLNGAMLMIEVLRRDLQSDERFAESITDLDAMRQSMLELVGTMDRFLQAERLRQGRVEVSLQTVHVGEFLEEQRRAIARQIRGVDGRIDIEVGRKDLCVVTDREMLTLVIQNTLSNCVKYAPQGRIRMSADCIDSSAGAVGACRIEVSDQGPGMDEGLQRRLFEPFIRGLDTGRPGTGLGLFIAKQASDLLGGKLRVESKLGEGTRFIVELSDYRFNPAPDHSDL